jgi:hypothetical protein
MMKTNEKTVDVVFPMVMKNSYFDCLLTDFFSFAQLPFGIYVEIYQSMASFSSLLLYGVMSVALLEFVARPVRPIGTSVRPVPSEPTTLRQS